VDVREGYGRGIKRKKQPFADGSLNFDWRPQGVRAPDRRETADQAFLEKNHKMNDRQRF